MRRGGEGVARHYRLCVIVALALVTVSACGVRQNAAGSPTSSSESSATTTSSSSSSPPPSEAPVQSAQPVPCTAPLLSGSIKSMDSAAGSRYVTLTVTNKSQQTCTLQGYGRVELLGTNKEPLPTNAVRNLNPVPTLVTLRPGATAGKILHWSVVAAPGEPDTGPCQPAATAIRVTPPDQDEPFDVDYGFGAVCAEGRLETSAYFPN